MATRTLLAFAQFEQYEDDGMIRELIQGEQAVTPPVNILRSLVRHKLHDALRPYVREHQLGEVYIAAGEGAPALAIEVASEPNTAAQLDLTMELNFAHGAEEVWMVFPQTRRVRAHFLDGHSETLATELHSGLFPGWSAPVANIFPE